MGFREFRRGRGGPERGHSRPSRPCHPAFSRLSRPPPRRYKYCAFLFVFLSFHPPPPCPLCFSTLFLYKLLFLSLLLLIFFSFHFWPCHLASGLLLIPLPGIAPVPRALGVRGLNHWTPREAPLIPFSVSSLVSFLLVFSTTTTATPSFPRFLSPSPISFSFQNY